MLLKTQDVPIVTEVPNDKGRCAHGGSAQPCLEFGVGFFGRQRGLKQFPLHLEPVGEESWPKIPHDEI